MIQPNIEIVAGQPNKSPIADGLGRPLRTFMGIGLLSDFINIAIAAALSTLLLCIF